MTRRTAHEPAGGSHPGSRGVWRRIVAPTLLQLLAMLGLAAVLYSTAANWFATVNHNSEISGYTQRVNGLPDAARAEQLALAHQYNQNLPDGAIRDPYALTATADQAVAAGYDDYLTMLKVDGTRAIGQLSYPRFGMGLPLFHGTSEDSLSNGVGHLFGSSLPVGGPSTHAVLTAHSGLVHAALFTPLTKAEVGDTFQLSVLGENLYYQVDSIETVLPEETESLRIVEGEDRVTLFTCTPVGVNSHRLLVHAIRVPEPPADPLSTVIPGDGASAGFPWWAVAFIGSSAGVAYLLFSPPRREDSDADPEGDAA